VPGSKSSRCCEINFEPILFMVSQNRSPHCISAPQCISNYCQQRFVAQRYASGRRWEEMGGDGRQFGASCCCASPLDFDLARRDIGVCETQASAKLRADCRAGEVGEGRGLSVGVSRPRPVDSKRFHRNVTDIQGFAQALQGSNEEEARDRIDGHGEGSAGHGAGTHICDAGVMTAVVC